MKSCPKCRRLFPDDAGFCPVDGVELLTATEVPPEPSQDDSLIGSLLGERYQVRRVVADGGMGRVYEALDLTGNRRVALKVLHPEVSRDKVAVARFKREFEISKKLPHEYIVEVFDFMSLPDGGYALAMDFLEGEELRAVLKRHKVISPGRLVRMVSQVALGLDEAHQRSLIHRDLKPDNIFLCGTRQGDQVKLLDFGSVKDKSEGAKRLTVMGTTIGSPFYMSPEQAQGLDTIDARADVWAMTAIIYECITGTVPFTGANGPSILLAILTNEPLPPSMALDESLSASVIPPGVDQVVDRGLAKDVEARFSTMGELANALGQAYGLEGDLHAWATTPQAELDERIENKLPELLAAKPAKAEQQDDPFAIPPSSDASSADDAGDLPDEQQPAGVSSRRPSLAIWLALAAVVSILLLVVVVWIFLKK